MAVVVGSMVSRQAEGGDLQNYEPPRRKMKNSLRDYDDVVNYFMAVNSRKIAG